MLEKSSAPRRSISDLDAFFTLAQDLFLIATADGKIQRANSAWKELLGYDPESLVGASFFSMIHPDDREVTLAIVEKHLEDNSTILDFTNRYIAADGSVHSLEWTAINIGGILYGAARDVTRRLRNERQVKSVLDNFRAFFDHASDLMLVVGSDGRILSANAAISPLLGYEPSEVEGRPFTDLITDASQEQVREFMATSTRSGAFSHTVPLRMRDDGVLRLSMSFVKGVWNDAPAVFATGRDLSRLVMSEEKFSNAFLSSPAIMSISDYSTGRYVDVNRAFEATFGVSRNAVLGKTFEELGFSQDTGLTMLQLERGLAEGVEHSCEIEVISPSGSTMQFLVSADHVAFSGTSYLFSVLVDISARKQAEKSLNRLFWFEEMITEISSELYGSDAVRTDEIVRDALAQIGAFAEVDRAYLFRYDASLTTMNNTHEWCAEGITAEKDNLQELPITLFPAWMETLRAGTEVYQSDVDAWGPKWAAEKEILQAQGVKSILVVPIAGGGNHFGFLGFDKVRGRQEWSAEQRRLLRLFANALATVWTRQAADLALRVNLAKEQRERECAEQSDRLKSDFLSMMSHEIRTPMNGVVGMTDLLLETDLDEKQRKYAEILKSSGDHLLAIINDILEYSKLEAGKFKVERIPFNPVETLRKSLEPFRHDAIHKGLAFSFHADPMIPATVSGDPTRLVQIVHNIMSNAIKFTDSGSVAVKAGVGRWGAGLCELRFAFEDTGHGIPESAQMRIFEPFEQADETIVRRFGGSGLGLAIVKELCDLMGGHVHLESEPGKGSTFTCTLPYSVEVSELQASGDSDAQAARNAYEANASRTTAGAQPASGDLQQDSGTGRAVPPAEIAALMASLVESLRDQEPESCEGVLNEFLSRKAGLDAGFFSSVSDISGLVSEYRFAEALDKALSLEAQCAQE